MRLFCSQVAASVPEKTLARFSKVRPVAVLFGPGVKARTTVTMIGTRTIAVMSRIAVNRHQRPRIARFGEDALVLGRSGDAEDRAGLGMGVDYCAHYSTLDFRIWRYRMNGDHHQGHGHEEGDGHAGAGGEVLEDGAVGQDHQGGGGVDRAAAGQQVDGGEVIDAEDRHQDPGDVRGPGDQRQRDLAELLPAAWRRPCWPLRRRCCPRRPGPPRSSSS